MKFSDSHLIILFVSKVYLYFLLIIRLIHECLFFSREFIFDKNVGESKINISVFLLFTIFTAIS